MNPPPTRPASASPPQPASRVALLALAVFLALGAATGAWIMHDLTRSRPAPHGPVIDPEPQGSVRQADKEQSLARMLQLADALMAYRDRFGGGLRWPSSLLELQQAQLLPDDFSFRGSLSNLPIVYQPDMPPSHDPGLWVLAHDRMEGRSYGRGRALQTNVLGAVVIFGDGSVRFLDDREVMQYGGLSSTNRPAR